MNGETSQKTSSGLFQLSLTNSVVRYVILFLMGSLAILLHARLRLHLGIPGHQGFLYMTMMVGSCTLLNNRFSGLAFSAGSVTLLSFGLLGFSNPFIPAEYIFVGIVADILLNLSKSKSNRIFFIILVGAFGYGMIPLVRMIITSLSGFPFGSFIKYGFGITMLSHIIFGVAGSLAGFGFSKLVTNKK